MLLRTLQHLRRNASSYPHRPPPLPRKFLPGLANPIASAMPSYFSFVGLPRGGVLFRYLCLGAGVAGVARYSLQKYGTETPEDQIRLAAVAAVTAFLGYLGHRYIRVAHCETAPKDDVDEALQKVHQKVQEAKKDVKKVVDAKVEELWKDVKEKYISEPAKEAFDFIEKICDNLRDFGQLDTVDFDTPLIVLLALVKKAQDRLDRDWLASLPKESEISSADFARHKRMKQYACTVYDASLSSKPAKRAAVLGVSEDEIVATNFDDAGDSEHCPRFVVLLDHETKSVVLVVRGTFSVTDVIIDVVCDDEDFLGGHAHRGILRGARAVLARAAPALRRAAEEHPEYGVCVTGHSLGAATAELVTMELLCDDHHRALRPGTPVECVALAPPPVFRCGDDRATLDRVHGRINIYVNGQDCIPRASLASAARLVAALRAVDSLPLTNTQKFHLLTSGGGESSDAVVSAITGEAVNQEEVATNLRLLEDTVAEAAQDRFPFLEHPGRIHYLYPASKAAEKEQQQSLSSSFPFSGDPKGETRRSYVVVRQSSQMFSRQLTVLERMVLDHLEWCYREAFDGVALGDQKTEDKTED